MTIRSTHTKFTGLAASLASSALLVAAASHSYAAARIGDVKIKPAEPIVDAIQGKVHDRGMLFRHPTTIELPPSPRVRDHRGEQQKFKAPEVFCGYGRPPCSPKGNVRDHRTK
jgi:hypothetical protein